MILIIVAFCSILVHCFLLVLITIFLIFLLINWENFIFDLYLITRSFLTKCLFLFNFLNLFFVGYLFFLLRLSNWFANFFMFFLLFFLSFYLWYLYYLLNIVEFIIIFEVEQLCPPPVFCKFELIFLFLLLFILNLFKLGLSAQQLIFSFFSFYDHLFSFAFLQLLPLLLLDHYL